MVEGSSSQNSAGNNMDDSEHTSIDINKIGASLKKKFETLYPLSQDCCIYRVPRPIRRLNPSDYTPQIVSIGPLHHGKEELKAMEEHKIRYLQHFLQRTKVTIGVFLALIKENEAKLRGCYAETIDLESEDFVRMILVDAVFLIEFFLRRRKSNLITNDDRIFKKPKIDVASDFWLVENQIPLFILEDLFNQAKTPTDGDYSEKPSFIEITDQFMEIVARFVPIKKSKCEINFSEARHILDVLTLHIQQKKLPWARTEFKAQKMPSATELQQAGVKFELGSSTNLLDITFNKGILKIPFLTVFDNTEPLYRNILAFENMHGYPKYFNDYVIMMSYLVNTAKDAELLIQNKIVGLGNGERLSTVFHSLVKDSFVTSNFQYSVLVEELRSYCDSPWHKWKATLKQDYFSNPWASISVIAAAILLALTTIQTVCSIIAL